MILNGSQRGGARDLAVHLLKPENEHIEVHEVRGFVSETIAGALREAEAISQGTKCRRYLYSLSLSPPETESVPVAAFESAIDRIEAKLGLVGHSRIVVFHEKQGRRHAHCVWSRINPETMTAPRLSHDRLKLGDVSRELYIEHGWKMPEGLIDPALRNPLNFTREEWLKAKPIGKDPRDIKAAFQQCWAASDSGKALRSALEARGYYLAKGDRRSVVAVDVDGEVYALARWTGVRTKELAARVCDLPALPTVSETKERLSNLVRDRLTGFLGDLVSDFAEASKVLEADRQTMIVRHRTERAALDETQRQRQEAEARQRALLFRKGLSGLWDRITGRHAKLRRQAEDDAATCANRDATERQRLVHGQLAERRRLQLALTQERAGHARSVARLHRTLDRPNASPDTSPLRVRPARRPGR
jgi:hypothetical protein